MGDWMGSCVDVKLGDGMSHFVQMTEMPHSLSKFNLEVLVFYFFYFLTHVKEGLPHYFLTMCNTWNTIDPSDLFVME